jgi:HAD superfamily hydrolase (TIGR01509 family)
MTGSEQGLVAAVFDLDGLMVNSEPLAEWAWNQVLARFGKKMAPETFREIQGLRVVESARIVCERLGLPVGPEEALAERERAFLEAVPTRLQTRPGLYALVDELDHRGLVLGLATSGHRRYVELALKTIGLEDRFRAVATGDNVKRGKPAPDIFVLAADRLGVSPADCLALEDSVLGAQSAQAAGMTCVVVPNEWSTGSEFPDECRLFPSLNDVREALDDLLGTREGVSSEAEVMRYLAAGGVVVNENHVLVLDRPSRGEVRLPKGHVEPGEETQTTALREVREESGYENLEVIADLGTQVVEFDHSGRHVVRTEHYYLMALGEDARSRRGQGEKQFEPVWHTWDRALEVLSFEAEREWVRRARQKRSAVNSVRRTVV